MTLEYATRASVGTLTPQANTTAEPELNMLWPAGFSMITARLTSAKPLLEDRLADCYQHLDDTPVVSQRFHIGAS
jgi:maleate isomerase